MVKTVRVPYHLCGDARQSLFAVQPGIPVADALDSAHSLLDVAESLSLEKDGSKGPRQAQLNHACHFLISAAKATLQACVEAESESAEEHAA
ncbi:hypothetical protein ACVW0Y_001601 [Pseudomonas sp. TE3786]